MMPEGDIGCNLDRHYHLGLGGIGEKGITAVVKFANKRKNPYNFRDSN